MWRIAIAAIVALAVMLRIHAFSPFDISHADELMQYLEQANRIATGHGIRPWETRYGLRNELIPQLLSIPLWIGHWLAPSTLTGMYLARATFAALTLIALPAAWRLGALISRRHALAALFVVAVWWESVLYSNLLLSESLGAAILLLSAAPLLDAKSGAGALRMSGFLLGLGVIVRLQFAPFAAVLFFYAVSRDRGRLLPLLTGGAIAAALGAASDLMRGAVPFSWVFVNFTMNIGEGRAAGFGVSGPFQYLVDYYFHFGAGALIFALLGALMAGRRYWPLLCAAVVTVAAHSLVGHKEYRFVWVATLTLLTLAAIGSLNLFRYLAERRKPGSGGRPFPLAATLAVWALLSVSSFQITGGYKAFRGGAAVSRLAVEAARRPGVCGLLLFDAYRAHIVPSLLPRPLPLSIGPDDVHEIRMPLPPGLAASANAFVAEVRPLGTEQYRRVACSGSAGFRPCLYVRDGTCAPDGKYRYQAVLERMGL